MQPSPTITALCTAASCVLLFGGCATAPDQAPRPNGAEGQRGDTQRQRSPQAAKPEPVPGADITGRDTQAKGSRKDAAKAPSRRTIYFDYDRFAVKDEYRPIVDAHAKYLRANTEARMLIQGHADERGSREYNIGLGQRRADVKSMLTLLGGQTKQIESVSLGEEKPVCTENAESCWAKNRRVHIRYVDEY